MAFFQSGAFTLGLSLGAVSVLSVGPNNLMLIREGLARGRVVMVATSVWASYVLLVIAALLFCDLAQSVGSSVRLALSWLGLLALSWFACEAVRAALLAGGPGAGARALPPRVSVRRVLAVVWLNPLTYLELLLVPAAVCESLDGELQRWIFCGALLLMAAVGCYGYALGAGVCGSFLRSRRLLRVFDLGSGLLLSVAAVSLAIKLIGNGL